MRFAAGTHCVPHLLAAGTHAGAMYRNTSGRTRGQNDRTSTPFVRALALHGVSAAETFGHGSHLGSTLKPGRAVLTGGVFRRSGSVACVRADASPSEVLASTMVDAETRCRQAH
jgi:hypothetical protein